MPFDFNVEYIAPYWEHYLWFWIGDIPRHFLHVRHTLAPNWDVYACSRRHTYSFRFLIALVSIRHIWQGNCHVLFLELVLAKLSPETSSGFAYIFLACKHWRRIGVHTFCTGDELFKWCPSYVASRRFWLQESRKCSASDAYNATR